MKKGSVLYAWSDAGKTTQLVAGWTAASTLATITSIAPFNAFAALVMFVSAGLVGGAVARWAIEADSAGRVVTRAVCGGALVAFVQGGCVLPFAIWISTDAPMAIDSLLGAWLWVAVCSLIVGAPFGAAVALFYTPLLIVASKARREPSHAAGEHVARFATVWLALAAGLQALVIDGINGRPPETSAQGLMWKLAWMVPLALAVGTFGAGIVSRAARRRWLARVRRGAVAGYRVEPIAVGDPRGHALLPVEHGASETCTEMIVRVADESNPGYRDLAAPVEDEPIALVRAQ